MDLERILGKHDLNERYIPNNTESPNFGQVMTLFHIGLGEEIPVNVAQAAVKIAIRDRDRVKSQIETWNGIVREGFGEKTSKMAPTSHGRYVGPYIWSIESKTHKGTVRGVSTKITRNYY